MDNIANIFNGDTVDYAIRFPGELRSRNADQLRLAGFIFNWRTDFTLTNEFSMGPRNKDDNDGGPPPGYIFVSLTSAVQIN